MKMFQTAVRTAAAATAIALIAPVASAWGPVADRSIVSAGTHVLGRNPEFNLRPLLRHVVAGASLTDEELNELHRSFELDPVGAIQREMVLLEALRGDRIDPYYAYRLGALGKLVASATAPLANASPTVRERYYADVDQSIDGVDLQMAQRKIVDPRPYFSRLRDLAASNENTIAVDYQGGVGFTGFARSSLAQDASRSVNAVADVWYTILTSQVTTQSEPREDKRAYFLDAIRYYLDLGNLEEVAATNERIEEEQLLDADMQKRIGDAYFDAGLYDQAITAYEAVLNRDPSRRDVVERVSEYYVMVGDEAVDSGDLEDAREAYADALEANTLHPSAQRKLLDVDAQIFARNERLLNHRMALEQARVLENRAEEASIRQDFARAIGLLREAERLYSKVTNEFPQEAKTANLGLRGVSVRLRELKDELIANSQNLSGSGFAADAQRLVGGVKGLSQEALREMVEREYEAALDALVQGAGNPEPF